MKKYFFVIILVFASSSTLANDFCNGFKEGYKTGYKQAKQTSLNPLSPLCPLKPLRGFGDPKSDYEFGYTLGFREGFSKAEKDKY